jgi:hypothetical protein
MSVRSLHKRLAVTSAAAALLGVAPPAASAPAAPTAQAQMRASPVTSVTVPGADEWVGSGLYISHGDVTYSR